MSAPCLALAQLHATTELPVQRQRCPGPLPVPLTHQGWKDIGHSSHTEEADSSAHSLGKLQNEQGRWEENGSWVALPSSVLLVSSGGQTPAQIPGLPHHPAELLDSTHRTSTKPHLAPSHPCFLATMHMSTTDPDPLPTPQPLPIPKSYMPVAPQEPKQRMGEGAFCGSCRIWENSDARRDRTVASLRHGSIHY